MSRETKKFHIGDVLSITTGLLVSPDHIGGVYNILNYMTRDNLFTHQLGRAADECKPYLLKQFPWLASDEFQKLEAGVRAKFELIHSSKNDKEDQNKAAQKIIDEWFKKSVYPVMGKFVEVEPLPSDSRYEHKEPIAELVKMAGKKKVIVVNSPE
jgi:hypothetical protein